MARWSDPLFHSFHFIYYFTGYDKTKQTLKMQICSNDTMITQDTIIYKVKPVDSTKYELYHNRVDLLKVLPANQTNKPNIYF